jgi:exosortase A
VGGKVIPTIEEKTKGFMTTWVRAGTLTVACIIILLAIYQDTFFSMVDIWRRSDTFAHCYLIFPISAFLVWRKRASFVDLIPCAEYRPLFLFFIVGFAWLLANLADVKVFEQFTIIAMIPILVWILLGRKATKEIAFPLAFLLFSVPFGDFLVPSLMDFTADFTVAMLKLTGIPIYREGTFFSIPSGDWSVVEACSGLRYLIASITLGCLFAYFNFTSNLRRLLFIIFAGIVPVIANGFRAYMIVMIAHLSDMTLAMGVDHFIYGWLFFGLVMALLFWAGSLFSDVPAMNNIPAVAPVNCKLTLPWNERRFFALAAASLFIAAIWPVRAFYIDRFIANQNTAIELMPPKSVPPWKETETMTGWEPRYVGANRQAHAFYTDGNHTVALFFEYYRFQEQGKELVNSENVLIGKDDHHWKMPAEAASTIVFENHKLAVLQGTVQSPSQNLLTWRWNWIAGEHTINNYLAKTYQARDKLLGRGTDQSGIILATEVKEDPSTAKAVLHSFVNVMLPSIEQSLNKAAARGNAK